MQKAAQSMLHTLTHSQLVPALQERDLTVTADGPILFRGQRLGRAPKATLETGTHCARLCSFQGFGSLLGGLQP